MLALESETLSERKSACLYAVLGTGQEQFNFTGKFSLLDTCITECKGTVLSTLIAAEMLNGLV